MGFQGVNVSGIEIREGIRVVPLLEF